MRASLFASATVTSRTGRRASTPRTHRPALLSQHVARQTMEVAPSTSSLRISALPAFVIPPKRVLPPVECCRGTRPSQAAKRWALRKAPTWSPTVAAIREAVIGPMPGIEARRRAVASWRAWRTIRSSRVAARPATAQPCACSSALACRPPHTGTLRGPAPPADGDTTLQVEYTGDVAHLIEEHDAILSDLSISSVLV